MALLQRDGSVVFIHQGVKYIREHNSNADIDIKRPKIMTDRSKIAEKVNNKQRRLIDRMARRKELKEMRRSGGGLEGG